MKRLIVIILVLINSASWSQILKPAEWSIDVSNSKPKIGEEVDLIFNVKIDDDWYLYSTDFDPNVGPMVTEFKFESHDSYELIDSIQAINSKKKYDSLWEGDYTYFKHKAKFVQRVKILKNNAVINGNYSYQVCTDVDGKCIPFDDDFAFAKLLGGKDVVAPQESKSSTPEDTSLLWFMALAFITGLAALVTPCVFPMIPMTVSFFLKDDNEDSKSGYKKGIFFGLSIVFIYTILGTGFAFLLGADGLNAMATHWIPNVFIFIIFIIFALSFLGLFEITLPNSFVNKVDAQADRGGMIGVFFMAFTLALVSFSCTVPIVGSVLVMSAGGEIIKPILGMLSFSMAFALPFTLFAIFPEWLKGLPKSGGWLNSVKVVLGFLELALALKFLSIADQAYHWHILDREIYLAIWIVTFTMMGFYFLGKLRLPHDSPSEKTSVGGLIMAIITFSFVVYLIPGMIGAPLKALAGYLPPQSSHDFNLTTGMASAPDENSICEMPKYADFLHLPHGIQGYFDYEQAKACAKEQNKPLFIDFTGHGCVNCREMEARVWSNPQVLSRLKKDFVVVALYVDDKTTLPKSQWYESEYDGKTKKTIGKQNADFQISKFKNNAQPYYVILDKQGEVLMVPKAYDLEVANFVAFLDEAKRKFAAK